MIILFNDFNLIRKFLYTFLLIFVFLKKVNKDNISQRKNAQETLLLNFSLAIHKGPTTPLLITFFKKHINLAIWKNIHILNIETLVINFRCHNQVGYFWFTTWVGSHFANTICKNTYSFILGNWENKLLIVYEEIFIFKSLLAVHY